VTPIAGLPWTATTVSTGFNTPVGALFDGANVWVTDIGTSTLLKLSPAGAILQTVPTGSTPTQPVFDGSNIWVPNFFGDSVTVVRAASGVVLATLTGNGLSGPRAAAFDGERILVTSNGERVSFWKGADLAPIGNVSTGPLTSPWGACSDGVNFWVSLNGTNQLARF
jgi:DNA-binding beta-propeller fold protein YncE